MSSRIKWAEFKTSIGKMIQRADKFFAFDEVSSSPVGQSISKLSKYHGRGRMDTKQKARSSSSVSRAGVLVNPILHSRSRKVHRKIKTPFVLARAPCPAIESIE